MTLQIIINRSLPTWKIAARLLIMFVKEIWLLTIVDELSGRKLDEYVHRDLSSPVQNKHGRLKKMFLKLRTIFYQLISLFTINRLLPFFHVVECLNMLMRKSDWSIKLIVLCPYNYRFCSHCLLPAGDCPKRQTCRVWNFNKQIWSQIPGNIVKQKQTIKSRSKCNSRQKR